jgi:GNAT superfamily N-acetyltransferase
MLGQTGWQERPAANPEAQADKTGADLSVAWIEQSHPFAEPLLAELAVEYSSRYGGTAAEEYAELRGYPATEFAAPGGALMVLLLSGQPVAGGGFRRHDHQTAELKRIWTSATHRRKGLGRRVLDELEAEIWRRGYTRIYLITGPRQPEAHALYRSAAYDPLFGTGATAEQLGDHQFEKRRAASS